MKKIRIERARLAGPLIALSLLLCSVFEPHIALAVDESALRAAAREHFAQGVVLAKAQDFAAALREFNRAYGIAPHFAVLYNIGQAELALGQASAGVATLKRYLLEGGTSIDPSRREEVESIIAQHAEAPAPVSAEPVAPEPGSAKPLPPVAPVAPVALAAAAPPNPPLGDAKAPFTSNANASHAPGPDHAAHSVSHRKTLAYVVGAAGLVLGAAAVGHYFWNHGRYEEWQSRYAVYYRDPRDSHRDSANSLAQSISRASVVTVALAVAGGLALSGSTVLFVTQHETQSARAFSPVLTLKGSF